MRNLPSRFFECRTQFRQTVPAGASVLKHRPLDEWPRAAFVDGELGAPRSLLSEVHRLYLQPQYEAFSPRTMWSPSNAFTSAFKGLDPVPQFKATAKLGAFLSQLSA